MASASTGFPNRTLRPCGGQIDAHLYESTLTQLPRNLYWSVTIDFEPIQYRDTVFECSLTVEWITWPIWHWRELHGKSIDVEAGEGLVESSFYMTEHDTATHTRLALHHQESTLFRVNAELLVNFYGYYDGDENPRMAVRAEAVVPFIGLLVVPELD